MHDYALFIDIIATLLIVLKKYEYFCQLLYIFDSRCTVKMRGIFTQEPLPLGCCPQMRPPPVMK